MTRNRMPSSRKRKRPSGPNERCQRSASSQSSSDDNRSGGRGCGRVIATFSATTSKGNIPHAAIAIASHMASDLRPEHKLPSKDILVSPNPEFLKLLKTVGAERPILTAREVLSFLIKYISSRQLYDEQDPKKVYCRNDPLGKVFGVDMFTIKEAKKLLFNNMTVINRGGTIPGGQINEEKKNYFTLVQRQFQEDHFPDMILPPRQAEGQVQQSNQPQQGETPPPTITTEPEPSPVISVTPIPPPTAPTEPMDSADGNGDKPSTSEKPKSATPGYHRNPLVPMGLEPCEPPAPVPAPVVTPPAEVAPVSAPTCQPVSPLSTQHPVAMDTAEDVKKATANVANLFRSVSLDVDPCQEGPSTAASTVTDIQDSPTHRPNKPGGKRTTKTRLASESSDSKSKTPSKSPPSQSDASEGTSSRQWVRLHYRPGEEVKSLSSERLSVQDYETVVVADSSDDLWFVEQEVSEFEIEYSVGDSSEGFASKGDSDDSSSETEMVFEVAPDDSSDSRWADDSSSTDTEISDQDKWDCIECQNRNPPVDRYCNRCWALRTGWLPDEQRMTLRERLLNQARQLRRSNSAPAGNMTAPHHRQHLELTTRNLTRHNNLTRECREENMEAMDTLETGESQAPIIRPGCSQAHCYQGGNNNKQQYPSNQCTAGVGPKLPPPAFCDRGYSAGKMTLGNGTSPYIHNPQPLEAIPDDPEGIGDEGELCPCPQPSENQGRDFPDGNGDEEKTVGRQAKTGEENGSGSPGGSQQGGPPNSQNQRSFGGSGFPGGGFSPGQGGIMNGSPRHAFGQATFGQPTFGQTTFGHSAVVNNSPPNSSSPRIFGQDLEGYSPSAGPKPGGLLHQGHFKSCLSEASSDSHHATCSANTLSPESELDDDKTSQSFNLVENDPIARKRMKMDTQRQDSGIGLSQEFSERSKVSSPDSQLCNDNYVHTHGDPPPIGRRRHSSTSELECGMTGNQDSTIQPNGGNTTYQDGAIQSNAFDNAGPSTSQEGQTRMPDICGFCFKRPKNASIIHGKTGHQVCCYQCAKKLRRRGKPCPICRQSIQAVIKNFLV